jgi:hypothetical protein
MGSVTMKVIAGLKRKLNDFRKQGFQVGFRLVGRHEGGGFVDMVQHGLLALDVEHGMLSESAFQLGTHRGGDIGELLDLGVGSHDLHAKGFASGPIGLMGLHDFRELVIREFEFALQPFQFWKASVTIARESLMGRERALVPDAEKCTRAGQQADQENEKGASHFSREWAERIGLMEAV